MLLRIVFALALLNLVTGYVASLQNNTVASTGPTLPPPVDED